MGSEPLLASALSDLCKSGLILEGIFNLRNSDFTHFFENGTILKRPFEINDTYLFMKYSSQGCDTFINLSFDMYKY